MKNKQIIALLVLIFAAIPQIDFAQGGGYTSVPFLLLSPDSRAGGMGETGGGLADDASAVFWNPAGLAFTAGSEVQLTHSNWLPQLNLDLFYDFLAYRQYIDEIGGSVSASIVYMNFGEFFRTGEAGPEVLGTFRAFDASATIGYATKATEDLGIGFNFRLIHSRLADQATGEEKGSGVATSVSFDVATMWRPKTIFGMFEDSFSLGINISNLGPKMYYIDQAQADPIPTNFRLGTAFRVWEDDFNSLTITADFSKLLIAVDTAKNIKSEFYEAIFTSWGDEEMSTEFRQIVSTIGMEYWYGDPNDFQFAVRSGFFYEDPDYGNRKFMTFGAGLKYDIYNFDFSYISSSLAGAEESHPLSGTLRFTLGARWGEQNRTIKGLPRGI